MSVISWSCPGDKRLFTLCLGEVSVVVSSLTVFAVCNLGFMSFVLSLKTKKFPIRTLPHPNFLPKCCVFNVICKRRMCLVSQIWP